MSDALNDDAFFGAIQAAPEAAYGSVADDFARTIGGLLGTASSAATGPLLEDPAVRQAIADATEACKGKAKDGFNEWTAENWHVLVLGGAVLLAGHWVLTTLALRLAFPRAAFQDRGSP